MTSLFSLLSALYRVHTHTYTHTHTHTHTHNQTHTHIHTHTHTHGRSAACCSLNEPDAFGPLPPRPRRPRPPRAAIARADRAASGAHVHFTPGRGRACARRFFPFCETLQFSMETLLARSLTRSSACLRQWPSLPSASALPHAAFRCAAAAQRPLSHAAPSPSPRVAVAGRRVFFD